MRLQPAGLAALIACLVANISAQPDLNYKPRRLNKAIELLEDGQPIYYTNANGGFGEGGGRGAPMQPGPPPPAANITPPKSGKISPNMYLDVADPWPLNPNDCDAHSDMIGSFHVSALTIRFPGRKLWPRF